MDLSFHIRRLYSSIVRYGGDFGDSGEWGAEDPVELLTHSLILKDDRDGVSIAALHYLMTAIDNSDFNTAKSDYRRWLDRILKCDQLSQNSLIERALIGFADVASEDEFVTLLKPIYEEVVLPAHTQQEATRRAP